MEIREVNFNAPAIHGKGGPPMATYVTPPRASNNNNNNNKAQNLNFVSLKCQSKLDFENTNVHNIYPSLSSSLFYPYLSPTDPQFFMDVAETNYPQCPCATCVQYRLYYAARCNSEEPRPQQKQKEEKKKCDEDDVEFSATTTTTTTASAANKQEQQKKEEEVEELIKKKNGQSTAINIKNDDDVMMSCCCCCCSSSSFDVVAEFNQKCAGRVAQLACSSEGRSILLIYLRSQDKYIINTIIKEIINNIEIVALDNNGCHVLRILLCDYMNIEEVKNLFLSFNETLILNLCTVSQYTRRILQFLFEYPFINFQFIIINILITNIQYLATTQQGCISLIKIFEKCDLKQKIEIITPLVPFFLQLSQDPFGNYVIQSVIEHCEQTLIAKYIILSFTGMLLNMSCNKYSSNVVEKIIKFCGTVPAVYRLLTNELIFNPAALLQMVQDKFGNFVIQSIIENLINNLYEFKRIYNRLRPALLTSPFAAKIEGKMRNKFATFQNNFNNNFCHQQKEEKKNGQK